MIHKLRLAIVGLLLLWLALPGQAYIEAPMTLGDVIKQSNMITVLRVRSVDKSKNLIVYDKVEDIVGKFPTAIARHTIAGQLKDGEIKTVMDWAEPGKTAIFFAKDGACETCIDNYWYQIYKQGDDLYGMSHGEPFLLRSFAGKAERLPSYVRPILEGKEILVPAMENNIELLHKRAGKIARLRTSLKLLTYDFKRDFGGWGAEDIRRIPGGTGFSHIAPLAKIDNEGRTTSVIDFDLDGKLDLLVLSTSKVTLFQNSGDAFNEVALPGLKGGAAAAWGDFNGDGLPDLVVGTPSGVKLFTNVGKAVFRDDSAMLPAHNDSIAGVAFADLDGDGKPDIIASTSFSGVKVFKNNRPADANVKLAPPVYGPYMLVGPFENAGGQGFDTAYPPEKEIDFAKQYDGKKQAKVAWRKVDFKDAQENNLAIFGNNDLNTEAVAYIAREITVPGPTAIPLSLGSDDGLAVFVNGERVFAENTSRAHALDQNRVTIKLNAGKNVLLLKITQGGGPWAFSCGFGPADVRVSGWFEDASQGWGFGEGGLMSTEPGTTLNVADFNGDGKPDLLIAGMKMTYLKNAGAKFEAVANCGLPGDVAKAKINLFDIDADGKIDVGVIAQDKLRVFKNNGNDQFTEISVALGAANKVVPGLTSVAVGDFNNDGKPDLFFGVLRGANRYFQNKGDGSFVDQSSEIGLNSKIYNTQAIATADINNDGYLDVVMVNENQESAILLGNKEIKRERLGLTIHLPGESQGLWASVKVTGEGTAIETNCLCGDGRTQGMLAPRVALAPGKYEVTITDRAGKKETLAVTLTDSAQALRFRMPKEEPKKEEPKKEEPKKN